MIADEKIGAVAVNAGPTLKYLTGMEFHLSERPAVLIISQAKKPVFIFPEFESGKVKNAPIDLDPFPYSEDRDSWPASFRKAILSLKLADNHIGVEPTAFRFLEYALLTNADPKTKLVSAQNIIESLRILKDEAEIKYMKQAILIAEKAFEKTLTFIQEGRTENEIANELVVNLLRSGSEPDLPFAPIVASGPNSANPHAAPGDRPISEGDLLIIDFGARSQGYISDITRTFAISSINDDLREVYQTVQKANEFARKAKGQKTTGKDIDTRAREVIQNAGYGDFFVHRTGHGIGLEAHEAPYISADNTSPILPGMTFTIEPGIYLPGRGGVRIEDNILARENHLESLTSFNRNLRIL